MNQDTVIADFPAYKIVQRGLTSGGYFGGKRHNIFFTEIKAGESLGLKRETSKGIYYQEFKAGTVVNYALYNGDDPIEAIDQARERNHDLHWINACGSVLSAHKRAQETWIYISVGMLVCLEGRLFKIDSASNQNLKLVPFVIPE